MTVFSSEIAAALGHYVYIYSDPRNGQPFYIGKGQGARALFHLSDTALTEKTAKITELHDAGLEPEIHILRYGLTAREAEMLEAAVIDLIGMDRLTNRVRGISSRSYGKIELSELIGTLQAKPVTVTHRALLITINRLYRSGMNAMELYEATRGVWKVGVRREKAEYAMAVYQGVIKEVYRIEAWYPAGTLEYATRDVKEMPCEGRWECSGIVAEDIRDRYIGFSAGKGGQNPVRYVNV